jgi:hypothetical protein
MQRGLDIEGVMNLENSQLEIILASNGTKTVSLQAILEEEASLNEDEKVSLTQWLQKNSILLFKEQPVTMKEALYYYEKGRRYRPTKHEIEKKEFLCPSCKVVMVKKVYKLRTPLFTCPECRWSIRRDDIYSPEPESEPVVREPGEINE